MSFDGLQAEQGLPDIAIRILGDALRERLWKGQVLPTRYCVEDLDDFFVRRSGDPHAQAATADSLDHLRYVIAAQDDPAACADSRAQSGRPLSMSCDTS
eukprot:scaffold487_cov344-Prasinococcus_capsulatus_cf.AAC.16